MAVSPSTPPAGSAAASSPFATFALCYMVAVHLELSEAWMHPAFTGAAMVAIAAQAATRVTRASFLAFLAATTAYWLALRFPDVANHVNLMLFCNLVMMGGLAVSLARRGGARRAARGDDAWYATTRPVLQVTLILVYVLAGFHKLNVDFVNPDVSCVRNTLDRLWQLTERRVLGVPVAPVLLAAAGYAAWRLVAPGPLRRRLPLLAFGFAVPLLAVGALVLAVRGGALPAADARALAVLPTAGMILLWEVVGGPLLAMPRLQLPVLAFSWSMHASLALINFVDFGGLALALLLTYVPDAYLARVRAPLLVRGRTVSRVQLYAALCVLVGVVQPRSRFWAGVLFNVAALVLLWPVLATLLGPSPRPAWEGVPITTRAAPRWMLALPALLVLHAATSYLGLRTAGNFSMFSNLRTEGERSNHLLLGGNPLKRWGYQEDVVRVLAIDDRAARIGYQYQPLRGNALPAVEFRKLVRRWTRAGRAVPMTLEYRGATLATADVTREPAWRTSERDLAMWLLDFRSIQPDGPNRCRW